MNLKKTLKFTSLFLFFSFPIFAQTPVINKIEPPIWWSRMKYNKIQLMVETEAEGYLSDSRVMFVSGETSQMIQLEQDD